MRKEITKGTVCRGQKGITLGQFDGNKEKQKSERKNN